MSKQQVTGKASQYRKGGRDGRQQPELSLPVKRVQAGNRTSSVWSRDLFKRWVWLTRRFPVIRIAGSLFRGAGDWSRYMHMNIYNIHTISLTSKTNQRG